MDHLSGDLIERLAEAIHERYRRHQAGRLPADDPSLAAWRDLPETLRTSSRAQAGDIPAKLRSIGCRIAADGGGDFAFSPMELEQLAAREHDRWVAERRASGWTDGPHRDASRRRTPFLVPYAELPEAIRELDRQAVRAIPELLRSVGLGIRRAD
jgi:hypothetical protein